MPRACNSRLENNKLYDTRYNPSTQNPTPTLSSHTPSNSTYTCHMCATDFVEHAAANLSAFSFLFLGSLLYPPLALFCHFQTLYSIDIYFRFGGQRKEFHPIKLFTWHVLASLRFKSSYWPFFFFFIIIIISFIEVLLFTIQYGVCYVSFSISEMKWVVVLLYCFQTNMSVLFVKFDEK